ncbi:hypothetical protein [Dysgonomonas sp. 25]|nr:hypothetical protein [Dysgonomonas sp. 25]
MIIKYFTDNDLYKFSVMHAIQRLYPWSYVSITAHCTATALPRRWHWTLG